MRLQPLLVAAPPVLVTAVLSAVGIGERFGGFETYKPRNIAEAAGMAHAGEVLRRLRLGEDPARVQAIRPEIISSSVQRATGLEAAMWSRQKEMIVLLDRAGAIRGEETRAALACLAVDLSLPDIAKYLTGDRVVTCKPQQALNRVLARTTRGEAW
ncbi:MAG TPA: hypothetical protein VNK41_01835 [Vicinamibacterales bacterium]|nr:hypothetical protein [Vicinamibacterales bacterium]